MEWINHNWINVLAIIGAVDGLFYAVTKITKTTWDDNAYTMFHNIVVKFFSSKQ